MELIARIDGREFRMMSKKEFCEWVGIRECTLRKWVQQAKVRTLRVEAKSFVLVGPEEDRTAFVTMIRRFRSHKP